MSKLLRNSYLSIIYQLSQDQQYLLSGFIIWLENPDLEKRWKHSAQEISQAIAGVILSNKI